MRVATEVDRYVLGTGEAGADRLRILHRAYGPGTRRFLGVAGLQPGMRVADVGCGVGRVTVDLAELVGAKGHVGGSRRKSGTTDGGAPGGSPAPVGECLLGRSQCRRDEATQWRVRPGVLPVPAAAPGGDRKPHCGRCTACCVRAASWSVKTGDLTSAGSEPPSALGAFAGSSAPWARPGRWTIPWAQAVSHGHGGGFRVARYRVQSARLCAQEEKRLLELSRSPRLDLRWVEAGLLLSPSAAGCAALAMEGVATDGAWWLAIMPRMAQVCCGEAGGVASKLEERRAWFARRPASSLLWCTRSPPPHRLDSRSQAVAIRSCTEGDPQSVPYEGRTGVDAS